MKFICNSHCPYTGEKIEDNMVRMTSVIVTITNAIILQCLVSNTQIEHSVVTGYSIFLGHRSDHFQSTSDCIHSNQKLVSTCFVLTEPHTVCNKQ